MGCPVFSIRTGRRPNWPFQAVFWPVQSSSAKKIWVHILLYDYFIRRNFNYYLGFIYVWEFRFVFLSEHADVIHRKRLIWKIPRDIEYMQKSCHVKVIKNFLLLLKMKHSITDFPPLFPLFFCPLFSIL